jgi:hypothetical protein
MEPNQQESFLQMHLDYDGGHILNETVRWSRFLSIVGFIGLGLCVLVIALASTALVELLSRFEPGLAALGGLGAAIIIIVALIFVAIVGFVFFMLYRFSTLTRKGIDQQDQAMFARGMRSLKIYFVINGVFGLLGLLVNLLSLTKLFHS